MIFLGEVAQLFTGFLTRPGLQHYNPEQDCQKEAGSIGETINVVPLSVVI